MNNIGATKRVSMADLRALVAGLGFRDVRTLLNSGNVVFAVPSTKRGDEAGRIERALRARMGITARVTVLSHAAVAATVRDNPFAAVADNLSNLLVMVLKKPSDKKRLEPLLKQSWRPEALRLGKRVAYIWCARGVAASVLWPAVDRALEGTGTVRNMATMTRILAVVKASSAE